MSDHAHHGPSYKDYLMIFVGLAILTTTTVVIANSGLGERSKEFLAFLIASVKTLMVATIFMHLRFETKTIVIFAVSPVVLAIAFILLISPDIGVAG